MVILLLVDGCDFTPAEGLSCWLGTEVQGCAAQEDSAGELSLCAPNPLPQELSLSTGLGNIGSLPPDLRVLLSNTNASFPSRELCSEVAVPAQQGPALTGQLLTEQDVLSGSQICRQQPFIAFYLRCADGE